MGRNLTDRQSHLLLGLALIITAVPVLITPMPPLLDYPNHYVRLWLIEGGAQIKPLEHMYQINWQGAFTNIFIDVVAAAAQGVIPVSIVGPAMLLLSLLLPGLGVGVLARQVHGRLTWWHILCVILGWSQVFLLGFINFQISIGLSLLGAGLIERFSDQSPILKGTLSLFVGSVLLIAHPFGLLLYALLIGGLAIGKEWEPSRDLARFCGAFQRALSSCFPLVALVAFFWLLAPHPGDHLSPTPEATQWQSRWIIGNPAILLSPFKTYRAHADLLFVAVFVAPAFIAFLQRRLIRHGGLLVSAAILAIGSLIMPSHSFGTAFLDIRMPLMLWTTLGVALLPDIGFVGRRAFAGMAIAIAIVAVRAEVIGQIWLKRREDLDAVNRVLAYVSPGASVLPMIQTPDHAHIRELPLGRAVGNQVDFWHLATLAVLQRHAFVPTLFANPGKQVIKVMEPFRRISVPEGAIPSVDQLGKQPNMVSKHEFPYLADWQCFNYVLVTGADVANAAGPLPVLPQITLVKDAGFARLYSIGHGRCRIPGLSSQVGTMPK